MPKEASTDVESAVPTAGARWGSVRVHLSHAVDLRAADADGLSDPYIVLKYGGRKETSAVVKKTLNPTFDWDFTFGFEEVEAVFVEPLRIEAWDYDWDSANDPIGHAHVSLADHRDALLAGSRVELAVALEYKPLLGKAVGAGELFIALTWEGGALVTAPAVPKKRLPKRFRAPKGSEPSTGGDMKVFLSHATDLRAADNNGFSDPYIKLTLCGMVERSDVVYETLNPTFNWSFTFRFDHVDDAGGMRDLRSRGW